jgi:thioredoxin reductase
MGREELGRYGVELREGTVTAAAADGPQFRLTLRDENSLASRKILLATGVVDLLPSIPCFPDYYGKSIHHCPYCDGWEHNDGRIAVYGSGKRGAALALKMKRWSADVVLCTDGPPRIPDRDRERLARHDVRVIEKKILRLEGVPPQLERIVFEDGAGVDRTALFFSTGNVQRSELIAQLGCELNARGAVKTKKRQRSSVRGVYVCGDAAEDSQYAVIAAAHGARAAMEINEELIKEDLR